MKTKLFFASLALASIVGSTAFATETGGGNSATAGASADAAAGAAANIINGDSLGLPGSASIAGAPGVDSDVFWIWAKSRPNGCYKAMMVAQTKASLGQPYSRSQLDSIIGQACGIVMTMPRTVTNQDYVPGGKGAGIVTRTSTMNAAPAAAVKPVKVKINGKSYQFSDPTNIAAYHACQPFTVPGDDTRYKKAGC